eukprot:15346087-Ditylum_brightwellii.AAC.1
MKKCYAFGMFFVFTWQQGGFKRHIGQILKALIKLDPFRLLSYKKTLHVWDIPTKLELHAYALDRGETDNVDLRLVLEGEGCVMLCLRHCRRRKTHFCHDV